MRMPSALTFAGLAAVFSVMPLLAHHSVADEYDKSTTVTIQGMVTKVEWMNPHARVWMNTKNADGTVSNWELELPPPNVLTRMRASAGEPNNTGNAGKDTFKQGDQLTVTLWRAKDGSLLGNALTISFPDGRVMDLPRGWLQGGAGSFPTNAR